MELFAGECKCSHVWTRGKKEGKKCERVAYFHRMGMPLCSIHSIKSKREYLPKNSEGSILSKKNQERIIEKYKEAAAENALKSKKGDVILTLCESHAEGFRKVFPTTDSEKRRGEGFPCPSLSPEHMGPVIHGIQDLPPSKNLVNYWEFSKVFQHELNEEGLLKKEFKKLRTKVYKDNRPHKYKVIPKINSKDCKPLFYMFWKTFVMWQYFADDRGWRDFMPDIVKGLEKLFNEWKSIREDKDSFSMSYMGHQYLINYKTMEMINISHETHCKLPIRRVFENKEEKFKEIDARWFYCSEYEKFALKNPDFLKILKWRNGGYNIQIESPEAYPIGSGDIYEIYKDETAYFGYERILYCLLTIDDQKDYPWNKYITQ